MKMNIDRLINFIYI